MKVNKKNILLPMCSAIIVLLCLLILLYVNDFAPFGTNSFASADANIQYIDFFGYAKNILLGKDSINFSYNLGLGNSGFGLFCYYLSSPFNVLLLFSNTTNIYSIFNIIIILKLCLCSATFSYYLIKRFDDKIQNHMIIILSISYALMQYNIAQSANIMWLDGVYMLPLILLGVYNLINTKKITLLSLTVAFSILSNWYTGGINCLFSIFWYLVEYLLSNKDILKVNNIKPFLKSAILYIISMSIGVAISAIIFLPNVYALRNGTGTFDLSILNLNMNGNILSTVHHYVFNSISTNNILTIFCGTIPLIGAISYFISKTNKRNKVILGLVILTAISFCYWQPFVFLFSLLKEVYTYWFRYSYVVIFTLIFISAMYFKKEKKNKNISYIYISILFVLSLLFLNYAKQEVSNQILFYTIIANIMISIILYLSQKYKNKFIYLILIVLTIMEMAYNSKGLMQNYKLTETSKYTEYSFNQKNIISEIKKMDSGYYRISELTNKFNFSDNQQLSANLNESLNYNYMSIKSYTSAPNNNELQFLNNMGYRTEGERMNVVDSPIIGADTFLGVKYILSPYNIDYFEQIDLNANGNYVYKNPFYLPLSILYNDKINKIEYTNPFEYQNQIYSSLIGDNVEIYKEVSFEKNTEDNKYVYSIEIPDGNYILYSYIPWYSFKESMITLNNIYTKQYSRWLANTSYYVPRNKDNFYTVSISSDDNLYLMPEKFYILDVDLLNYVTNEITNKKIDLFEINKNEINIQINNNKSDNLLITIPNSQGWQAKINNKKVNTENFANCLISIPLEKGKNNISLKFVSPGLISGCLISIFGIIFLIIFNIKLNKLLKYRD